MGDVLISVNRANYQHPALEDYLSWIHSNHWLLTTLSAQRGPAGVSMYVQRFTTQQQAQSERFQMSVKCSERFQMSVKCS